MSQSKYDELFKNLNYIADEIKETNSNPKDNYFIKAYYKETGYIFDDSEIMNTVINEEMNTFANLKLSGKPKAIKITNNIE